MSEIDGVTVTPLRRIPDERGAVFHMLREDSPVFERFGEIYFSTIYPGVVKGWHVHKRMTLNYAVPAGMIKLVCYDDREGSPTTGQRAGDACGRAQLRAGHDPARSSGTASRARARHRHWWPTARRSPHDPDEIDRLDPFDNDIPYDWSLKHG